jgi:hypothetical protein
VLLKYCQQRPQSATHRQAGPGAHAYLEAITLTTEPNGTDQARALADVGRDYPPWHAWEGVFGLLYARWPQSSPPMVVRAVTPGALRQAIEAAETEWGLR